MPLRIIYLGSGDQNSTSYHRAQALVRLGHSVSILDPYDGLKKQLSMPIIGKIHYRTGYKFLKKWVITWLNETLFSLNIPIDLIWVNSGELFDSSIINSIRYFRCPIILYNNDDPTGKRDGNRFNMLLDAIPSYDLCVVMREFNVAEYYEFGAQNVMRITMSYDEIAHKSISIEGKIPEKFKSDVAFIGTWIRNEGRDRFLLDLIKAGVPVSIWGGRWSKSPVWNKLKPFYRGDTLGGQEYVYAIKGAKINLGMLSKGNRDLHTQRSLEVPFAGGLLCAERTKEHLSFYEENEEAVFWADASECGHKCKWLLDNPEKREEIRQKGMKRVKRNRVGNEDIAQTILNKINEVNEGMLHI